MFKELYRIYSKPSINGIVTEELEDAKRNLLLAETAAEYATSQVSYRLAQIARLERYVGEQK